MGKEKPSVTIIIPAWNADKYIDECLKSIKTQTLTPVEVLIGVDACENTLEAAKKAISCNIPHISSLYWFPNHSGPYLVRNTLASYAKGNVLVMFDADDVMYKNYVESMSKIAIEGKHARARKRYVKYGKNRVDPHPEDGALCGIKKNLFLWMGGYDPWLIQADTAFMKRCMRAGIERKLTEDIVFVYRKQSNSLTERKDTGKHSLLRRHVRKKMQKQKKESPRRKILAVTYCEKVL